MLRALRTRVGWFCCSSASWSASALITVPSIPMVSEVARSIPPLSPVVPRQILPPPTTTASSSPPPSIARPISLAIRSTVAASMVSSDAAEANASPDILRTMRRGSPTILSASGADDDLREGHDARRTEHARDGLLLVTDVGLVEEDALLEPTVHSAVDDLVERGLRLALVARDGLERRPFRRHLVRGDLVPVQERGLG